MRRTEWNAEDAKDAKRKTNVNSCGERKHITIIIHTGCIIHIHPSN